MKHNHLIICTFGDTGYQIGQFLKKQNLKKVRIFSFVHSGFHESAQGIVANAGKTFEQSYTQHIGKERHSQNWFKRWWNRHFKRNQLSTIILIAGLGGRYSSCVTPQAALIARQCGYDNIIAIVQTPFDFEGTQRRETANAALSRLKSYSDKLIIFDHQQLLKEHNNLLIDDYFKMIDQRILEEIFTIHNSQFMIKNKEQIQNSKFRIQNSKRYRELWKHL